LACQFFVRDIGQVSTFLNLGATTTWQGLVVSPSGRVLYATAPVSVKVYPSTTGTKVTLAMVVPMSSEYVGQTVTMYVSDTEDLGGQWPQTLAPSANNTTIQQLVSEGFISLSDVMTAQITIVAAPSSGSGGTSTTASGTQGSSSSSGSSSIYPASGGSSTATSGGSTSSASSGGSGATSSTSSSGGGSLSSSGVPSNPVATAPTTFLGLTTKQALLGGAIAGAVVIGGVVVVATGRRQQGAG
jgi:hypothetical protein